MKKSFNIIFSSFALFTLIACTGFNESKQPSSIQESDSSLAESQMTTEASTLSISSKSTSSISSIELVYYHVTFKNYDETILEEKDVLSGEEAVYEGKTPTKEEDDEFTYEFDGWDKELTSIVSDLVTIAQFKAVSKIDWGPIIWL